MLKNNKLEQKESPYYPPNQFHPPYFQQIPCQFQQMPQPISPYNNQMNQMINQPNLSPQMICQPNIYPQMMYQYPQQMMYPPMPQMVQPMYSPQMCTPGNQNINSFQTNCGVLNDNINPKINEPTPLGIPYENNS